VKPVDTITTNRFMGRRSGRGNNPHRERTRRPNHGELSCRRHDDIFRERKPNPRLCWVLLVDGNVAARAGQEKELFSLRRIIGGEITKEAA
jgi:hypothetical protein